MFDLVVPQGHYRFSTTEYRLENRGVRKRTRSLIKGPVETVDPGDILCDIFGFVPRQGLQMPAVFGPYLGTIHLVTF